MNTIYNSDNYCVVEFVAYGQQLTGGFEIMDKTAKREIFLDGDVADNFRRGVADLIASAPSEEEVDDFLSQFDAMMFQPMHLH